MPGPQPRQDPDLASIGIESRLIPHIIAVESGAKQRASTFNIPPTEDAQTIVDILDRAFSSPTVKPESRNRWIKILCEFSRLYDVRPKSCSPCGVTLSGEEPYKSAGSVEVWKAEQGGNQVCVKTFRMPESPSLDEIRQGFKREIVRWKYILHPNVLPFLGVSEELPEFPRFCIINPWLENGNILGYIERKTDVDRLQLLVQATRGLMHLHLLDIVHGGIHPGNILITEEGSVRLADFGIAAILTGSTATRLASIAASNKRGVVRYKAPELLGDNPTPLKESDVYSLAMIAFEVLSGVPPYERKSESLVAYSIATNVRPTRPKNETADHWLSDSIWDAIQDCWGGNPQSRLPLISLRRAFGELEPGEEENFTVTGNGSNGPERVIRRSLENDFPSGSPRMSLHRPPRLSQALGDPMSPPNQRARLPSRANRTSGNPPISSRLSAHPPEKISPTSKQTRPLPKRATSTCCCCQ